MKISDKIIKGVKEDWKVELRNVEDALRSGEKYLSVGEIGLDLYWDKTFALEQEKALEFGLKLNELLLLDYMLKFFNTDRIKRQRKGERFYCRLTYNKVLDDLPILRIKERQLRNMIIGLEKKGIVERFSELKNQMYLYQNFVVIKIHFFHHFFKIILMKMY